MRKFEFRLQRLLDIREALEKQVQNELAELINIQNIERLRQTDFRRRISENREALRRKMLENNFSYEEVKMFEKFSDSANKAIDFAEKKIIRMEPDIRKVRERLIQASKEKKVVEKLKERKWKEYQYDLNRGISTENDDMNQKSYNRNKLRVSS